MRFDIVKLTETSSTNDDAKMAAQQGAPQGKVFWALKQTAGRGRQGRQWVSSEGNLFCSIVLRPQGDLARYGLVSFVAALAIWDVISVLCPNRLVQIKWPNDVLIEDKKVSGTLLEAGDGWVVVGIGINILYPPDYTLYPTTCLALESQANSELEDVLNRLLTAFGHWFEMWEKDGFAQLRRAWLARARKGSMRVRLPNNEIQGEFSDLDAQGHLCLILPDKSIVKVSAGDVFF